MAPARMRVFTYAEVAENQKASSSWASCPTATPSATNLSLREFASTFLRAGLEHLEPCQMPSAVSVATDAQQTGPWAGSHLQ